jgi:hypothetical protein
VREKALPQSGKAKLRELLRYIDDALEAYPVVTDERQIADIAETRQKVIRLCEESKIEEAARAARICVNLIRQDEPTKE